MTILCDIDNVLNDFSLVLLAKLNKRDGTDYLHKEITHYGWFEDTFKDPWEPTKADEFWDDVCYYSSAIFNIRNWINRGHKIYLVTASHYNCNLEKKFNGLFDSFGNTISDKNIIITQNKALIKGDILIDDCFENVREFYGAGGNAILFERPWNKQYLWPWKTNDWNKIDSIINSAKPCGRLN